jgi:hypothetical protein
VAGWLDELARAGKLSRRSIQIIRMVLRAALDDAVAMGDLRRNPAGKVKMPRQIAKQPAEREADAWTEEEMYRFLGAAQGDRWEGPLQVARVLRLAAQRAARPALVSCRSQEGDGAATVDTRGFVGYSAGVVDRILPMSIEEWTAGLADGEPPTPDDQSRTWDGRTLDTKQAVVDFLAELEAARLEGRSLGPDVPAG